MTAIEAKRAGNSRGGKNNWAKLTTAQRRAKARMMAAARWEREKALSEEERVRRLLASARTRLKRLEERANSSRAHSAA